MRQLRQLLALPVIAAFATAINPASAGPKPDQQVRTIRIGVALMTNLSTQAANEVWERNQLMRDLLELKTNRKSPIIIEPVQLQNSSEEDAPEEAAKKDCQYVVFTTLVAVRRRTGTLASSGLPLPSQPGIMNGSHADPGGSASSDGSEETVSVDFKIVELTNLRTLARGTSEAPNDDISNTRAIDAAMQKTAIKVASELRKDRGVKID